MDAAIGRGMKFLIVLQHVALKGHVKTSSKYYYVKIPNWEDSYKVKKVELMQCGSTFRVNSVTDTTGPMNII